jgi:positive regulator of sigma E activity
MTADAVVVAARTEGCVDLEFAPTAPCASCAGTCLWKRAQASRLERLANVDGLAPGTEVTVALHERWVLLASLLLHGIPLLAILLGSALGSLLVGGDAGTFAGAAVAVLVVIAAFGRLRRRLERATLARLEIRPRQCSS